MLLREGCVDILEMAKDKTPKQFTDFKNLKNSRTGKYFSQTTISDRLKSLVELKALEKAIIKTSNKKDVVGYKITLTGLKILDMSYEFEEKLERLIK